MSNIKYFVIATIILIILIIIYEGKYYILWFFDTLKITLINKKNIKLVLIAEDASDRTKKQFNEICLLNGIPIYETCKIENLSKAIGKTNKAVIGIKEKGFAESVKKIINGGEMIG